MEKLFVKDLSALPHAIHHYGFRAKHSTTTSLCHLTHDIATGFNRKRPPDRTVLAAVDLTQAFDRVNIDKLLRHLLQSNLNPAVTRWLAVYLRGRMARTLFRDASDLQRQDCPHGSAARLVHLPLLVQFHHVQNACSVPSNTTEYIRRRHDCLRLQQLHRPRQ